MVENTNKKLLTNLFTCMFVALIFAFGFSKPAFAAEPDDAVIALLCSQSGVQTVQESQDDFVMPTVADLDNPANEKKIGHVAGTDAWNDLIYSHCSARGIDPIFVKSIMAIESAGQIDAKNGSYLGLYQVGKAFGYDSTLMLSDADYQTEAALNVIETKIAAAIDLGIEPSVYYVAKFYNGSESYAKTLARIYEDLNGIEGSAKTNLVKNM